MTFTTALNVLKHQSLPALVQEELERMIMEGRLLPGEQLREITLSALLGVERRLQPLAHDLHGLPQMQPFGLHVATLQIAARRLQALHQTVEQHLHQRVRRGVGDRRLHAHLAVGIGGA